MLPHKWLRIGGHPHGGSEGGRRGELAIGWPRLVVDAAGIFSNFELRNMPFPPHGANFGWGEMHSIANFA